MAETNPAFHYVCTRGQAWDLVKGRERFWVSNCDCRESRGGCKRSRMDLCLQFRGETAAQGSNKHEITLAEVEEIFREAERKRLVTRPFRCEDDLTVTDGICFCCDDCCGYFLNREERCDKDVCIELTDMKLCTHCGICEEVCYFRARRMDGDTLAVNREECYGCGLCEHVCPEDCIQMTPRN